ncbi:hypothetical protein M0R01_00110 [bacterium]|nr:hypothetical protein [bacterium]
MEEKTRFDKVILSVVVLIGAVFIGISSFSVFKNNSSMQQASTASLATLKTKKADVPVNGICGSANEKVFESSPSANLCSTGNASVVILEENDLGKFYMWQCLGINNGITASCRATANIKETSKKVDAKCGDSDGTKIASLPSSQTKYCEIGNYVKGDCSIPIYDSENKEWKSTCSWSCVGVNGGGEVKCSATLVK